MSGLAKWMMRERRQHAAEGRERAKVVLLPGAVGHHCDHA
jgi:hypothetical protein